MSRHIPTPSNFIGAESAHYLSVVANSYGRHWLTNASGTAELGAVIADPPTKTFSVTATVSAAYGAGESLTLDVRYLNTVGVPVFKTALVLNATTAAAAGEVVGADIELPGIKPGHVLQIVRTYVAGTPNDPEVALYCQLT
jgi:hypothetical protein